MDYPLRPIFAMEFRVTFHGVIPLSCFFVSRDSVVEFHVIPSCNHVKFHDLTPFFEISYPLLVLGLSYTVYVQMHA